MMDLDENIKLIDYTQFSYLEFSEELEGKTLEEIFKSGDLWYDPLILDETPNSDDKIEQLEKHKEDLIESNGEKYKKYKVLKVERDTNTGFYAVALQSPEGEIVVSYKGSDFDFNYNDWGHNILELPNNYVTDQGQQASKFLEDVLEEFDGNVTIAGHSLGGFLAQIATLNNVEYINRINKTFAFDSPGFPTEVIKEYKDIIKRFTDEEKMYLTEMTVVSQLMNDLPNINVNYIAIEEFEIMASISLHPIEKLKSRFTIDQIKAMIKPGKLAIIDAPLSILSGSMGTSIASLYKVDKYKDLDTNLKMQITLSRENLTIEEFLEKVDKNLKYDDGKLIEKVKTRKLKETPQYLVRGAILKCDKGSHMRRIDLRRCHGVYFKKGPVLHIEDCEVGEEKNIKSFGMCSCTLSEYKPDILEEWLMGHEHTYIVRNEINLPCESKDLLKALPENSFLVCSNGGLIEPISFGQEYYEENEKDIIMINDNLSMEIK